MNSESVREMVSQMYGDIDNVSNLPEELKFHAKYSLYKKVAVEFATKYEIDIHWDCMHPYIAGKDPGVGSLAKYFHIEVLHKPLYYVTALPSLATDRCPYVLG